MSERDVDRAITACLSAHPHHTSNCSLPASALETPGSGSGLRVGGAVFVINGSGQVGMRADDTKEWVGNWRTHRGLAQVPTPTPWHQCGGTFTSCAPAPCSSPTPTCIAIPVLLHQVHGGFGDPTGADAKTYIPVPGRWHPSQPSSQDLQLSLILSIAHITHRNACLLAICLRHEEAAQGGDFVFLSPVSLAPKMDSDLTLGNDSGLTPSIGC